MYVWWNFEGMIHWEFTDHYSQQLERVYEIWRRRYPELVNRSRVLLQARPHTARTTVTKIQEFGGMELLPHSAYSPHLAPSDYHLFGSMAHFLCGRNFEDIQAVDVSLTEFFATKTRDWCHRGIINLSKRWLKTMESDGLYFEE